MEPLSMPTRCEQQVLFIIHNKSMDITSIRSFLPKDKTQTWVSERLKALQEKGFLNSRRLWHRGGGGGAMFYYETDLARQFHVLVQDYHSSQTRIKAKVTDRA